MLVVPLALFILGSSVAFADVSESVWLSLERWPVSIELWDGTVLEGRLLSIEDDEVSVVLKGGRVETVQKSSVKEVYRRSFLDQAYGLLQKEGRRSVGDEPSDDFEDLLDLDSDGHGGGGIAPGELRESAFLSPHRTFILNATLGDSSYRVHRYLDLGTNLLQWSTGPNLTGQVGLLESDSGALSLKVGAWKSWRRESLSVTSLLVGSWLLPSVWVNASAGVMYDRHYARLDSDEGEITWLALPRMFNLAPLHGYYDDDDYVVRLYGVRWPVALSADWLTRDRVFLHTGVQMDAGNIGSRRGYAALWKAAYIHEFGAKARLSAGVLLLQGEYIPDYRDDEIDDAADDLEDRLSIPEWPVSPLPWLQLWWAL